MQDGSPASCDQGDTDRLQRVLRTNNTAASSSCRSPASASSSGSIPRDAHCKSAANSLRGLDALEQEPQSRRDLRHQLIPWTGSSLGQRWCPIHLGIPRPIIGPGKDKLLHKFAKEMNQPPGPLRNLHKNISMAYEPPLAYLQRQKALQLPQVRSFLDLTIKIGFPSY